LGSDIKATFNQLINWGIKTTSPAFYTLGTPLAIMTGVTAINASGVPVNNEYKLNSIEDFA
jgi:hypothetical protein